MHDILPDIDFRKVGCTVLLTRPDKCDMLPVFGKWESMRLLDGYEDFRQRTLAKIPGRLGKALFMRHCRRSGNYSHWGMLHAYGEILGSTILRRIDRDVHLEVLRTPMDELLNEMLVSEQDLNASALSASQSSDAAILGKAGVKHLQFVCETLGSMVSSESRCA